LERPAADSIVELERLFEGESYQPASNQDVSPASVADRPRQIADRPLLADRIYRVLARSAAVSVLVVMALIGLFLLVQSLPAWHRAGLGFLTKQEWSPNVGRFGISAVLLGTVLIAVVALVVAVPLAFGTALYISEYAPAWARRPLISLIDLMAAIPSIVFALYGFFFLQPRLIGVSRWLSVHAGWFPPFRVSGSNASSFASSTFIAGIVVALPVIPIVCALMREAFSQAPIGEREAALALGATRWAVIRTVVLPFGKGGMIGASMLGLGRALGETVTVYVIVSPIFYRSGHILQSGGNSIAALIASQFEEATKFGITALMAAGLVLFGLTLTINTVAAAIVARSRSGALTEI
jgi:phosphate transport system permease protein